MYLTWIALFTHDQTFSVGTILDHSERLARSAAGNTKFATALPLRLSTVMKGKWSLARNFVTKKIAGLTFCLAQVYVSTRNNHINLPRGHMGIIWPAGLGGAGYSERRWLADLRSPGGTSFKI